MASASPSKAAKTRRRGAFKDAESRSQKMVAPPSYEEDEAPEPQQSKRQKTSSSSTTYEPDSKISFGQTTPPVPTLSPIDPTPIITLLQTQQLQLATHDKQWREYHDAVQQEHVKEIQDLRAKLAALEERTRSDELARERRINELERKQFSGLVEALEDENRSLKQRIEQLEAQNESLCDEITDLEAELYE